MIKLTLGFLIAALAVTPVMAQGSNAAADFKTSFQKHLQTSEDFTLKVADAMPAENYDFKLTPEQMSYGGQMTHLATALGRYASRITGQKPPLAKPASEAKVDVVAFVKASFDFTIAQVASLTPEQIAKTYGSTPGQMQSGYDLMMAMLVHTTNHRASAEMYLRAKGITPPQYQF